MRLRLVKLSKKFVSLRGMVAAVNEIDFEIKDKEFFVLLGPSGCGKSTVLNLIAGLEKPTRGEIWFDERLVASGEKRLSISPKERNVAFVFQSYALYPHLNVFENIAFPLKVVKTDLNTIKESVSRVSSMLRISDILSARPGELSGGQRQRIAIARAIVRHPNIFLLDEPLSNLDAQLRLSTRDELKEIQRTLGVTTVYVTHDQVEAMTLGDRIAVLRDGKVEQIGAPDELYETPANTFVAGFIGSPPMNIFNAEVFEEGENLYILIGSEKIRVPDKKTKELRRLKENSCILGIRPEDIHVNTCKVESGLKGKIELIEMLGREKLLRTSIGGHRFSSLTMISGFREGEAVNIEFNLEKLHIFRERG